LRPPAAFATFYDRQLTILLNPENTHTARQEVKCCLGKLRLCLLVHSIKEQFAAGENVEKDGKV